MEDNRYEKRLKELKRIFKKLPKAKLIVLSSTIDTVAFMDIQLKDLEEKIKNEEATTPDKQLYSTMAKTRDSLIKKLLAEMPAEVPKDDLSEFLK